MKFSVATQAFKRAVDLAGHATVNGSMTPILENILIDARFKKLIVVGNNLEMAIECGIEEDIVIEKEWSYTIGSRFLGQFLSLVQDEQISVELVSGGMVRFSTPRSETKHKGIEAAKFPVIPVCKWASPVTFKGADLKAALEKTIFSTASATIRPTLAGVYLEIADQKVTFASTDSFRLSDYVLPSKQADTVVGSKFIIPAKTVAEILRITGDNDQVELLVDKNQILFTIGDVKLFSGLLNGHFPDYQNFFPKKFHTKAVILRSELISAIKRMNLISKEKNYTTHFKFEAQTGLKLSTGDTEIGAANIEIAASIEWSDITIGLNATYLLEVLWVIRSEHVSLEFETPLSPIVIKSVPEKSENGQSYRHLIMPLKI